MLTRVTLGGLLAVSLVAVAAAPAEAFGRRSRGSSCATPVVHCEPICHPIYCPPCIPGPVIPTAVDCVKNLTNETLRIHISSGFGHAEAVVPPNHCFYFVFRTDNTKPRVVTAFTLQNDLVANYPFSVIAQSPPYDCTGCLPIVGTTAAPTREAPKREPAKTGGATGAGHGGHSVHSPSNSPI